jgi:hypothetical protein
MDSLELDSNELITMVQNVVNGKMRLTNSIEPSLFVFWISDSILGKDWLSFENGLPQIKLKDGCRPSINIVDFPTDRESVMHDARHMHCYQNVLLTISVFQEKKQIYYVIKGIDKDETIIENTEKEDDIQSYHGTQILKDRFNLNAIDYYDA